MNNDETERALNDFILNEDDKLQKLIDTLERIEKAGTLDKLFEGAEELSPIEQMKCMFSHCDDSFEEARRVYALATAQE